MFGNRWTGATSVARIGGLAAVSALAMLVGQSAVAQETVELEEIIVTGTRVARTGFTTPTPTTVVDVEELARAGTGNIAAALNQLPAFRATFTPASRVLGTANIGGSFMDLRGLGTNRTLVLVNGRRHVAASASGQVDINMIPQALVKRVDVVTGGASAAWGSDAVSGVVNIVLDDTFEGAKASIQTGVSDEGDNQETIGTAAFGAAFAGGRGHVTLSGEAFTGKGITNQTDRDWARGDYQTIANPLYTATNGQPRYLIAANVHQTNRTEGGLILGPSLLAGQQFMPGGTLAPFVRSAISGSAYQVGGDGINQGKYNSLVAPYDRQNIMGTLRYDLTDNIRFRVETTYAASQSINEVTQSFNVSSPYTISVDNAFLSNSLRSTMVNNKISSFTMGRINTDFGFMTSDVESNSFRQVAGVDGDFGDGWNWSAYYQHGRTRAKNVLHGNVNTSKLAKSTDSVLVNGTAVCRVNADASATNDDLACVPVNLFGYGSPSQAAIGYFTGDQLYDVRVFQDVAAADLKGEPFSTWAGPVSTAVGFEYRKERVKVLTDPVSEASGYLIGNPKALKGDYSVKEGFAEMVVPLLKDTAIADELDFNAAVRLTDYSTSGSVTTWKVGTTYHVTDEVLLRGTRSRDIRAPNVTELFTAQITSFSTVIDPKDNSSAFIPVYTGGNPNLQPEKADTLTAGIVLEPDFVPGLRLSLDYYDISIDGAIQTLSAQAIVTRCFNGNNALCSLVQRNSGGTITSVSPLYVNLSSVKTDGLDVEAAYTMPLGGGHLTSRLLVNYVSRLSTDDGVTAVDRAGEVGPNNNGVPHWRGTASLTYSQGGGSATVRGRYIGGGKYDNTYTAADINDNHTGAVVMLDLAADYKLPEMGDMGFQVFANVNNVLDRNPPVLPSTFQNAFGTNPIIYDLVGRYFLAGLRVTY